MPSLCLLCVAMLVKALSLWVSIPQEGDDDSDKKTEEKTKKQDKEKLSDSESAEEEKSEDTPLKLRKVTKTSDRKVPGDKEKKELKRKMNDESSMSVANIGANYLLVHLIGYAVMNSPVLLSHIGKFNKYCFISVIDLFYSSCGLQSLPAN